MQPARASAASLALEATLLDLYRLNLRSRGERCNGENDYLPGRREASASALSKDRLD
jgi:hypothetical protein